MNFKFIISFQLQGIPGVITNQQVVSECKTEGPHSKPERQSIPPCRARSNIGGSILISFVTYHLLWYEFI